MMRRDVAPWYDGTDMINLGAWHNRKINICRNENDQGLLHINPQFHSWSFHINPRVNQQFQFITPRSRGVGP